MAAVLLLTVLVHIKTERSSTNDGAPSVDANMPTGYSLAQSLTFGIVFLSSKKKKTEKKKQQLYVSCVSSREDHKCWTEGFLRR